MDKLKKIPKSIRVIGEFLLSVLVGWIVYVLQEVELSFFEGFAIGVVSMIFLEIKLLSHDVENILSNALSKLERSRNISFERFENRFKFHISVPEDPEILDVLQFTVEDFDRIASRGSKELLDAARSEFKLFEEGFKTAGNDLVFPASRATRINYARASLIDPSINEIRAVAYRDFTEFMSNAYLDNHRRFSENVRRKDDGRPPIRRIYVVKEKLVELREISNQINFQLGLEGFSLGISFENGSSSEELACLKSLTEHSKVCPNDPSKPLPQEFRQSLMLATSTNVESNEIESGRLSCISVDWTLLEEIEPGTSEGQLCEGKSDLIEVGERFDRFWNQRCFILKDEIKTLEEVFISDTGAEDLSAAK